MGDFEQPMMACPRCGAEQPDYDGLGFAYCDNCSYCAHFSFEDGRCTLCGAPSADRPRIPGPGELPSDWGPKPEIRGFLEQSNYIEGEDDNIAQPYRAWAYLQSLDRPLRARNIEIAHKILMLDKPYPPPRGWFRDKAGIEVSIGERRCTESKWVRRLMDQWVESRRQFGWRQAHIEFEKIHPFADGNGRLGRILMNCQRLEEGLPIMIVRFSDRADYYKWFSEPTMLAQ